MGTIMSLVTIAITASLINNVVLSQFLGICPFLGVSRKVDSALGMGGAVIFVITVASLVCSSIYHFILSPFGLTYLNTIVFIMVIAMLVQFVEMFLKKFMVAMYEALGIYLPLITTNCAVLGVALLNVTNSYNILESVINGLATAIGFALSIVILAGVREKTEYNDIPEAFKGMPAVLLSSALMAIAFNGFSVLR